MFPVPGSIFYPVQRRMHSPVPSGGSGRVNTICYLLEGKAPLPHPFPSTRLPAVLRQNRIFSAHGGLGGALPGIFLRQKLPDTATILLAAENHMKTGPFPAGKRARSFGVFFV